MGSRCVGTPGAGGGGQQRVGNVGGGGGGGLGKISPGNGGSGDGAGSLGGKGMRCIASSAAEIVDALWDWAVNYGLGVEEEEEQANEED